MATRLVTFPLLFTLVLACSTTGKRFLPADMAAITVYYSSGGPAPSMGTVQVLEDGMVIVRNQRGQARRQSLSNHQAFRELIDGLAANGLTEELAALSTNRYDERYFDYEELVIEALGTTVSIPTEKAEELPASMVRILDQLETLARVVMKEAMDFQLGAGSNL